MSSLINEASDLGRTVTLPGNDSNLKPTVRLDRSHHSASDHIPVDPVDPVDQTKLHKTESEHAHQGHHHRVTSREAWKRNRARMLSNGYDWPVVIWLAVVHIGALLAPFFFSWTGLFVAIGLHWLTGGIGVCLGYHRFLTHSSFKAPSWVRYTLALIGGLSGEGSALHWTANHRKHHAHSDHEGDPHSPLDGPWWSHIMWTMAARSPEENEELHNRWIPDLKDDKGLHLLHALFLPTHIALGLILCVTGLAMGGLYMATSLVLWGMFLRLAAVLHSTWFVNSASHMWGYRNYETTDESRNNWWVALLTYGEGWHNNHHAYPRMARHGHKWWEVDLTFITIKLMEKLGWASEVVDHQHEKKTDLNTVQKKGPAMDTESVLKAHYAAKTVTPKPQQDEVGV